MIMGAVIFAIGCFFGAVFVLVGEKFNSSIGAWATYGDSIPIDSLAESINETIRAGQVTGTFANVLNWGSMEGETFGVTMRESTEANAEWNESVLAAETAEDYFNLALQNCKTEAERADLVLRAMADQGLTQAADKWKENNDNIIQANEAQMEYEEAQARLAEKLTPFRTKLTELKTWGFDLLCKAVDAVSSALETVSGRLDTISGKKVEASVVVKTEREYTGSSITGKIPSHALGLDYVPYDGYIAELHKGEMVLTSEQADIFRNPNTGLKTASRSSIFDRFEQAISRLNGSQGEINITVQSVLDGKIIGEASYKYIRNKQRAYGV